MARRSRVYQEGVKHEAQETAVGGRGNRYAASGSWLASAASASAAPAKVTLTWWTWTTNPQHVIANFEKAYPNITIQMPPDYGSGGTFYPKLTTALAGGTGPV